MKLKEIICCILVVFFCSCENQPPVAEVLNGSFEKTWIIEKMLTGKAWFDGIKMLKDQ